MECVINTERGLIRLTPNNVEKVKPHLTGNELVIRVKPDDRGGYRRDDAGFEAVVVDRAWERAWGRRTRCAGSCGVGRRELPGNGCNG